MKSAKTNGKVLKAILRAQGIQVDFPMTLKFEGDEINISQGEFAKIEIKPFKEGKVKAAVSTEATAETTGFVLTKEEFDDLPNNLKSRIPKRPI